MTASHQSQLVNALTFARVPLIFIWAFAAVWQELTAARRCVGWALFAIASAAMLLSGLTDLWDGRLARKWGVVSALGKMADPLMDKVFYIVAFPVLSWQALHQGESQIHSLVLVAFTVLYMLRDTWVSFMRMVGAMYGADVAAAWLGKVRTALSFPGAGWIYVYLCLHRFVPPFWNGVWLWSCYLAEAVLAVLTVWSMLSYTVAYWPYMMRALKSS